MTPWLAFFIGLLSGGIIGLIVGLVLGRELQAARSEKPEAADPTNARFKDWKP